MKTAITEDASFSSHLQHVVGFGTPAGCFTDSDVDRFDKKLDFLKVMKMEKVRIGLTDSIFFLSVARLRLGLGLGESRVRAGPKRS